MENLKSVFEYELVNFFKNYISSPKGISDMKTFADLQGIQVEACKEAWQSIEKRFNDKFRSNFWSLDKIRNDNILSFMYELYLLNSTTDDVIPVLTDAVNLPKNRINHKVNKNTTHPNTNIEPDIVIQDSVQRKVDTHLKRKEKQPCNTVTQDVVDKLLASRHDKEVVQIDPQNLKNNVVNLRNSTNFEKVSNFDFTKESSSKQPLETVISVYTHRDNPDQCMKNIMAVDQYSPLTKKLPTQLPFCSENKSKDDNYIIFVSAKEPDSILKGLRKRNLEVDKEMDISKKTKHSDSSSKLQHYVNNILSEINDFKNQPENFLQKNTEEKGISEDRNDYGVTVDVEEELTDVKSETEDVSSNENCHNTDAKIVRVSPTEKLSDTGGSIHKDGDLNNAISRINDITINSSNTITLCGEGNHAIIQLPGLNDSLRVTRRKSKEFPLRPRSLLRHYDLTTKEFFIEIGKYINKKFTSQKQKELCTQIRSMVNTMLLEET